MLINDLSFRMRLFKESKSNGKLKLKERDFLILEILDRNPGIIVGKVSEYIKGTSLSTISVDLKRLRKLGIVDKYIDIDDERKFCFRLTKKGAVILQESRDVRMNMFQQIIDTVNNDNELEIITGFVKRVLDRMKMAKQK